jgi:glucose-1-phosphate thymidylyltransferase
LQASVTAVVSRQLPSLFDKLMIYLSVVYFLMLAFRDILIFSTTRDKLLFEKLLGNGSDLGLRFSYAAQGQTRGLADAFIVGREFIGDDRVGQILGDNLLWSWLVESPVRRSEENNGATIVGHIVNIPALGL